MKTELRKSNKSVNNPSGARKIRGVVVRAGKPAFKVSARKKNEKVTAATEVSGDAHPKASYGRIIRMKSQEVEPSPEQMRNDMQNLAKKLQNDPELTQNFFFKAGLVTETGEWKEHYRK